jgi:hypothetical protein
MHEQNSTPSSAAGKDRRVSTKDESLSKTKEVTHDWYLLLRRELRCGEIKSEKSFRDASEQYLCEYDIIATDAKAIRNV